MTLFPLSQLDKLQFCLEFHCCYPRGRLRRPWTPEIYCWLMNEWRCGLRARPTCAEFEEGCCNVDSVIVLQSSAGQLDYSLVAWDGDKMLTSLTRRYFRVVFFSKIKYQSAQTVFPSLTIHLCSLARAKLLNIYWKPMPTCCFFLMCVSATQLSAVSSSRAPRLQGFYLRVICGRSNFAVPFCFTVEPALL